MHLLELFSEKNPLKKLEEMQLSCELFYFNSKLCCLGYGLIVKMCSWNNRIVVVERHNCIAAKGVSQRQSLILREA